MTAKEKVLTVYPDAYAVWSETGHLIRATWRGVQFTAITERFETEEAAWQNAAESLPAAPEQDENDEESLLPCPFCGGTAQWGESPDSGHFIECSKCQSSTNLTYYLMDDASRDVRERWNRRVK